MSILVVCVASRSALIVELALKQFSTRSDTPMQVRRSLENGNRPSSMSPSNASHKYGFTRSASTYVSIARFESPDARCIWPIKHNTAPVSGRWFRETLLWSSWRYFSTESTIKGVTSGPFVWNLSQTVFQGEQAFSKFTKLSASLRKHVGASEMAMTIGDIVRR